MLGASRDVDGSSCVRVCVCTCAHAGTVGRWARLVAAAPLTAVGVIGHGDDAHGLLEQPTVLSKKAVASSLTAGKKEKNIILSELSTDLANLISG